MKPKYTDFQEMCHDIAADAVKLGLPVEKLSGRGKSVFFCPACNMTRPMKGRKLVCGRAVCSVCFGKSEGPSTTLTEVAARLG